MALVVARFVLLVGLGAGCFGSSVDPAGPTRVHIQSASTTFESAFPAELDLALGSTSTVFQFSISGVSDRGVWSARAFPTMDQVLARQASLPITSAAGGAAAVQIGGSKPLEADGGTLDFSFGAGQVSGTVTGTSPELLDSTFVGDIVIACWVPSGPAAPDGSESLMLDADFATIPCAPFRALGP